MPGVGRSPSAAEHGEPIVERRSQPLNPQQLDTRRRQLERQRDTVQLSANLCNRFRIGVGQIETGVRFRYTLDEELDCRVVQSRLGAQASGILWRLQWVQPLDPLALGA